MAALLYKDDHNKVAYLEKGKGWEAYEQILDFLNRSHIQYALTHRPPIMFDSLDKQFWATATVRTLEAGPSKIIATIAGNEVVVTESLIRTQLQLNDKNGFYEFTLHDVLDGIREFDYPTDGPHMPLLAPMLMVSTGGDGADAAAAGANEVPPPPPPPDSNEAPPTTAAIAAGGAEDSAALTNLSLKLDRVKRLEGLLQQRKRRMVLSDSEGEEAATKEKDIDLDALHKLASTSLGGDTTVEAAYTIYKASQDAHASSDAGHAEDAVHDDTIMPFKHTRTKRRRLRKTFTSSAFEHFHENISAVEDTIPAGDGIPAAAQTILAGSTPIPTIGGVSAGSSIDPTGQVVAVAPSLSVIPAADKGKAPMVDDFIPTDLLTEQERVLKNLHDYQLGEDLAKKLQAEQEAEFAWQQEEPKPTLEAPSVKRARQGVPLAVHAASSQVPAASLQVPAGVPAASSIAADVSVSTVSAHADTEVHADESHPDDNKTASEQVSAKHTVSTSTTVAFTSGVSHATPSSSCKHRMHIAKKRVTPIVDVADDALIKIDSASESDGDPSAYAPYAGWEIFPTPFSSIHAYYDIEEHTKHFTSLRKLLHMVEKNDLRRLPGDVDKFYQKQEPETFGLILCGDLRVLFQSLADEDAHAFWRNQESWCIRSWCLYPYAQVHVLETVDGQVIYIFVDVSYPLSEATLKRMLKHGLEAPKLLVGGDLTMAEQLVSFIKAAILNAQSAV
nr:hypothetical protein [Tanacetum cinerariifolium]